MHRVRVRNRASVGATVARRAYSPAPICACVSTRQAIRRRDRTRQPVTTPQLVTPLESVKQLYCRASQDDGWLATVSDAPLHCILWVVHPLHIYFVEYLCAIGAHRSRAPPPTQFARPVRAPRVNAD
ncbi:hypothetical protein EVAR_7523_1 [Eumeta japonica]|uniref:Uncharacterized protein n=1 Tax=Eumeta variegata TaxID=151549 RepID=A0A4C2A7K8_EUMVA|nr:hypothetical protein EVAR_7523_1 [Eumeta japonica]